MEQGSAKCIDIGATVNVKLAPDLFRGDIVRRPECFALFALCRLNVRRLASQTHIRQLHNTLLVDHDILRLDVTMYQTVSMSMLECIGKLDYYAKSFVFGEHFPFGKVIVKRLALDIFHYEIVQPAGFANVDRLNDIVVIKFGSQLPFFVEACDVVGLFTEAMRQHFDRYCSVKAQLFGFVNNRHRT